MQANRGRDTSPEVMLRSALFGQGLRFRNHGQPIPGLRCHADVVFPTERVAAFVDGCFWRRARRTGGCEPPRDQWTQEPFVSHPGV
jgi:DNA mismatch endonuclease Vsr